MYRAAALLLSSAARTVFRGFLEFRRRFSGISQNHFFYSDIDK
jgi:hypothetical protein